MITKNELLEWFESLGININRLVEAKFTIASVSAADGEDTPEVYLEIKRYAEDPMGRLWIDSAGKVAVETVFIPVTHLGVRP